jgi:hypothetical protein
VVEFPEKGRAYRQKGTSKGVLEQLIFQGQVERPQRRIRETFRALETRPRFRRRNSVSRANDVERARIAGVCRTPSPAMMSS